MKAKKLCILADADSSHTKKWIDYYSTLDYDIYLISMRDTRYKYNDKVKLHVVKPKEGSKLNYFFIIPKIKKLIKTINPDIVHSFYATSYGLFGAVSKVKPLVVSVWGSDVYLFPKQNAIFKKILQYVFNSSNVLCSTSRDMAKEIRKYNSDKNIIITPFGVNTELFKPMEPLFKDKGITLGVMKGLEKIYGIDTLIKAVSIVSEKIGKENVRVIIVGDGTEENNLKELAQSLDLNDNIDFVGRVENSQVPYYINKCDTICLCSHSESFGVAALEASACERPVIATGVGGLKEVVKDNITGLAFEDNNEVQLAEKIISIYNNREKAKVMGKQGRQMVLEEYDWENNVKVMKDLYDTLL